MKTLLQLEQTFFDLAASCQRDTLVISDRGAMDPSSCKIHHGFKALNIGLSTQLMTWELQIHRHLKKCIFFN